MKTLQLIKALLLVVIFIFAVRMTASAGNPEQAPAISIRNNIVDNLKFPDRDVVSDPEGVVDVTFVVDEGKICIEKITSENAELAKYVKKELCKICCKNSKAPSNSHYSVKLTFKLL